MGDQCTAVCVQLVDFSKARISMGAGACVETGFHATLPGCGRVHVRNSRFPERVVYVPRHHWEQLVRTSQDSGRVELEAWFPVEAFGDFAASFTVREVQAFESGILNNEPQVCGR